MKNQMKITVIGIVIILLILGVGFLSCQKNPDETSLEMRSEMDAAQSNTILYYTCGMHPSVRVSPEDFKNGNSKCPLCNMDLVPVYAEQMEMGAESDEHQVHEQTEALVKLSSRAQDLARVKTEEVRFQELYSEIKTVGQVEYDERQVASVAAWISGRIDKLFVDFTGIHVKKGDPLAWVYSPDLLTTQEEYLLARETLERVKGNADKETVRTTESLVRAAIRRLVLWGISQKQIDRLDQRKITSSHMTIFAPIGGTVIQKDAQEGKYVEQGEDLYQIADLSTVWVLADIYEYELSLIKEGQSVEITAVAYPGERFQGKIAFIDPYLDTQTRSVKVRVDVANSDFKLKPGMSVDVMVRSKITEGIHSSSDILYTCPMHPEIMEKSLGDCPICGMPLVKKKQAAPTSVLAVPREAVIDTGTRQLVYIEKDKGVYSPIQVELGLLGTAMVNGKKREFYSLSAGLFEGMRVVSQANFLIDSQSQITGQAEAVYSGAIESEEDKEKPSSTHIH